MMIHHCASLIKPFDAGSGIIVLFKITEIEFSKKNAFFASSSIFHQEVCLRLVWIAEQQNKQPYGIYDLTINHLRDV